jgi:HK97 family phage portal protein
MFGLKIVNSKAAKAAIEREQDMLNKFAEFEVKVSQSNELNRALYEMLSTGLPLGKDSKVSKYITEGYEGNPDLFSIVMRLASMFADVKQKLVEVADDGTETDAWHPEIERLMRRPNYYQTYNEFKVAWAIFRYITGNAIVYAPKFTAGLNTGKVTGDGLLMMPTQDITIKSKGWKQPIGWYTMQQDETYKVDALDVWHERFAPTLEYTDGKNFMGMSPVKAAANLINSQNAGYELTAKTFKNMHPPSIIYKEGDGGEQPIEQEAKFRERYKTKYSGINNFTTPIFTMGKVGITKIGFEDMKDLQVIEMSEHGKRVFCNLLQVPSELFGDTAASTYNNKQLAEKAIYRHRIIPDQTSYCEGFTEIVQAYNPRFRIVPDYSGVEALQEDKKLKSEWVSKEYQDGVITGDEYLELMGQEPTGLPEMQIRWTNMNRVPLTFDPDAQEDSRQQEDNELNNDEL